jgi:hypothetical protein
MVNGQWSMVKGEWKEQANNLCVPLCETYENLHHFKKSTILAA